MTPVSAKLAVIQTINAIAEVFCVVNGRTSVVRFHDCPVLSFAAGVVFAGASSVRIHVIDAHGIHVWKWKKAARRAA